MGETSVVIVDDQYLLLKSLKSVIESLATDICVVGLAKDGAEGVALVDQLRPDVVLMDIRMPGMDGVQATREIAREHPDSRVIVLTTFEDDEYVRHALDYGAYGYLLKDVSPEHLVAAIRAVREGVMQMSPSIAHKLVEMQKEMAAARLPEDEVEIDTVRLYNSLSLKEREILKHIYLGLRTAEIAERVYLAPQTIRNYISDMYGRLDCQDREGLRRFYESVKPFLNSTH